MNNKLNQPKNIYVYFENSKYLTSQNPKNEVYEFLILEKIISTQNET